MIELNWLAINIYLYHSFIQQQKKERKKTLLNVDNLHNKKKNKLKENEKL
jgi:hypothetical protein